MDFSTFISEKYTSQAYLQQLPIAMVAMLPELPGYASGRQIIDENQALAVEQIPGLMGRDLSDLIFTEKEGVEYLQIGGHVYQSGDKTVDAVLIVANGINIKIFSKYQYSIGLSLYY